MPESLRDRSIKVIQDQYSHSLVDILHEIDKATQIGNSFGLIINHQKERETRKQLAILEQAKCITLTSGDSFTKISGTLNGKDVFVMEWVSNNPYDFENFSSFIRARSGGTFNDRRLTANQVLSLFDRFRGPLEKINAKTDQLAKEAEMERIQEERSNNTL